MAPTPPTDPTSAILAAVSPVVKDIYDDAAKPVALETGRALGTVGRAANAILMPLRTMIYGVELVEEWLNLKMESRFAECRDKLTPPPANVAVPAIAALCYSYELPEVREMFANLLATSMHADSSHLAHPAFVEFVKQLTPDEARVIHLFRDKWTLDLWQAEEKQHVKEEGKAGYYRVIRVEKRLSLLGKDASCEHPQNVPQYVDNLLRMGLVYETRKWACTIRNEMSLFVPYVDKHPAGDSYPGGERLPELATANPWLVEAARKATNHMDGLTLWRSELRLTPLGITFCLACVTDRVAMIPGEQHLGTVTVMAEEAL